MENGSQAALAAAGSQASGAVEAPASPQDIRNCALLLLGHEGSTRWHGQDGITALVRDMLASEEFLDIVLPPVLLREELPHAALGATPPFRLVDWAQQRLPLTSISRLALGAARTWSQTLELVLADPILADLSRQLILAEVDQTLRDRLEREHCYKTTRSVIGAVDSATPFEVKGWAIDLCDKSKHVTLEFSADGVFIGTVCCNEYRPDVHDLLGGSGTCGFTFKIAAAHRSGFANGRSLSTVDSLTKKRIAEPVVVSSDGARQWDAVDEVRRQLGEAKRLLEQIEARLPEIGKTASVPIESYDEYWNRFYRPSPDVLADQRSRSLHFNYRPLISVVMPVWNSQTLLLKKAIDSVVAQSYERWELIVTDDHSERDEIVSLLQRYKQDERIRWIAGEEQAGISINTNRGIEAAKGDYVAFLDHDDELAPDALFCNVQAMQGIRPSLLYSDEDRIEDDELGRCVHHTPFFKPDFDPDLLLAMNYICHFVVVRREVLDQVGGLRSSFDGAQDHDFLLRCSEAMREEEIIHLHRVLYHWRVTPGSMSGSPERARQIQNNVVAVAEEALVRRGLPANAEAHRDPIGTPRQFATRVRWKLPDAAPSISIIICTRDHLDLLEPCVRSVLDSLVNYPGKAEVLLVDNDTTDPATLAYMGGLLAHSHVSVMQFHGPFNWSAINNSAARKSTADLLIILNNDTVVLTPEWCAELAAIAMRPDVGAVGARLLYADGTIQHAGVVLGIEGVAGHECVGDTPGSGGYFGRSHVVRGTAAVTGACLATRRQLFLDMDGFEELHMKVAFNDVDYCLRLREAGHRVIYNPFAVLYHLESKSRGRDVSKTQQERHRSEAVAFRARWKDPERLDPFYNAHFERYAEPFKRLRPPPPATS